MCRQFKYFAGNHYSIPRVFFLNFFPISFIYCTVTFEFNVSKPRLEISRQNLKWIFQKYLKVLCIGLRKASMVEKSFISCSWTFKICILIVLSYENKTERGQNWYQSNRKDKLNCQKVSFTMPYWTP